MAVIEKKVVYQLSLTKEEMTVVREACDQLECSPIYTKKGIEHRLLLSKREMMVIREALQNSSALVGGILDALKEGTDVKKRVEMTPAPMC